MNNKPIDFALRARVALCEAWPLIQQLDQKRLHEVLIRAMDKAESSPDQDEVCGPSDIPPTLTAVTQFLVTLKSDLDPQEFLDFYASKNWMVGKTKMKDWHAAARRADRTWDRHPRRRLDAGMTWEDWSRKPRPASEWELKQKRERLAALEDELRCLRFPGGCAYPVFLTGGPLKRATDLADRIQALRNEINGV